MRLLAEDVGGFVDVRQRTSCGRPLTDRGTLSLGDVGSSDDEARGLQIDGVGYVARRIVDRQEAYASGDKDKAGFEGRMDADELEAGVDPTCQALTYFLVLHTGVVTGEGEGTGTGNTRDAIVGAKPGNGGLLKVVGQAIDEKGEDFDFERRQCGALEVNCLSPVIWKRQGQFAALSVRWCNGPVASVPVKGGGLPV